MAEFAYYEAKEPRLGERFLAAVEATTARALAFPLTGTPASARTRWMYLGDFIFALAHHARRPDYWRSRMDRR